jgi:hypothetical protein
MNICKRIATWFDSLFSDALADEAADRPLFEPDVVYPRDGKGCRYIDLTGTIVSVDEPDEDGWFKVDVRTDRGSWDGYGCQPKLPKVGYTAVVRVYDWGGGYYPENHLISWDRGDVGL